MLVIPYYLTSFSYLTAYAEENTNPWITVSTGDNEVNEVVEINGKNHARLGTGKGNDNGENPALFREEGAEGKESGVMEYTFIPETEGATTRLGFTPHYKDSDRTLSFVGYDKGGWFYEYKVDGDGEWLQNRPSVSKPEPGNEYTIKVEYHGTTLNATLNGQDLSVQ